jgi:predicted flap endonuclease-1-like 5' DNA nuclease
VTASAARNVPAASRDATRLEDLPNVGPAVAADLRAIGIARPAQLAGRDPYALYDALNRRTGVRHDPCVLDTFIAAVRFVEGAPAKPWWAYTAERKRTLAARAKALAKAPAPGRRPAATPVAPQADAIAALPNLGTASARKLAEAGITSVAALRRLGAVEAWQRVRKHWPGASLNLLWALEGALTGRGWQEVARTERTRLLLALDDDRQAARHR